MRSKRHSDLHEFFFACILMASIWLKVLTTFSFRNTVLQAGDSTLDVEVENIKSQIEDLKHLRESWEAVLIESKLAAESFGMATSMMLGSSSLKSSFKKL